MRGKKGIKAVVLFTMICTLFCAANLTVSADNNEWGGKTSGLTNAAEAEDIWENVMRGTYLQKGTSKISNLGNQIVRVTGGTDAYQTCDMVRAIIYLDRYVDGTWIEVDSAVFTAANAYTVNGTEDFMVTSGYYYRARGYHTVKEGSTTETTYTLSDGIYIN